MPTFQSIRIHPSVRHRLLHPNEEDASSSIGIGGHRKRSRREQEEEQHQQHRRQQEHRPLRSGVSIPRSLLTRDPSDLADLFLRGDASNEARRVGILAQVETIRYDVALAMISKTRNGRRLACHHGICHSEEEEEEQQQDNRHPRKKRRPFIHGGSISAWDAWKLESGTTANKHRKGPLIVSTGCPSLDRLVGFPAEYCLASSNNSNNNNNGQHPVLRKIAGTDSGEIPGLPWGYVLKLSGTGGKTQLALQLASQAILQNNNNSNSNTGEKNHHHKQQTRIRYCYSTAGHSGSSLAKRVVRLLEENGSKTNTTGSEKKAVLGDAARQIEFQPIATLSQLLCALATIEEEWLQNTSTPESPTNDDDEEEEAPNQDDGGESRRQPNTTVSMLVLDALPWMMAEREDAAQIRSLDRWLKRLARHYSMLVVVVVTTSTGGTGGGGGSMSVYDTAMSPDVHLSLQKRTPATLSVRLMRHPAKAVTENDCVVCTITGSTTA